MRRARGCSGGVSRELLPHICLSEITVLWFISAMKKLLVVSAICALGLAAFGQGQVAFHNTSGTLISANGVPMPVSGTQQFYFAIFFAPPTTVDSANQTALFTDPAFQVVTGYNTNSPTLSGRTLLYPHLAVGPQPGPAVDFVVRGWSANAGATWAEALATWNNGTPLTPMFIGTSVIGNNIIPGGGGAPVQSVFGTAAHQVPGFNMEFVPEPSILSILGLGAAGAWLFRRRTAIELDTPTIAREMPLNN